MKIQSELIKDIALKCFEWRDTKDEKYDNRKIYEDI